jgi:predicted nucleic acid-binding protein
LYGLHRAATPSQRGRREAFLDEVLEAFVVLAFDLPVAREHARIWAELAAVGQSIGVRDSMIAATALTHRYSLMTDNIREFRRVPGLEVRQPS